MAIDLELDVMGIEWQLGACGHSTTGTLVADAAPVARLLAHPTPLATLRAGARPLVARHTQGASCTSSSPALAHRTALVAHHTPCTHLAHTLHLLEQHHLCQEIA